jgi:hypothetical protein
MYPFSAMRELLSTLAVCAALALLAAGCGSSSSSSNPWATVTQTKATGKQAGLVRGDVGRPGQAQVSIESTPSVTVSTRYTVVCSDNEEGSFRRRGPTLPTPFTVTVQLPDGNPASCTVILGATKSAAADLTLTLSQRAAPTPPPTP